MKCLFGFTVSGVVLGAVVVFMNSKESNCNIADRNNWSVVELGSDDADNNKREYNRNAIRLNSSLVSRFNSQNGLSRSAQESAEENAENQNIFPSAETSFPHLSYTATLHQRTQLPSLVGSAGLNNNSSSRSSNDNNNNNYNNYNNNDNNNDNNNNNNNYNNISPRLSALTGFLPSLTQNRIFSNKPSSVKPDGTPDTCLAGMKYEISSVNDLIDTYRGDYECIFALADAPRRPPLGIYSGQVLELASTTFLNNLSHSIWSGKLGLQTQCQDADSAYALVMNFVAGAGLQFPALAYIDTPADSLDGTKSLIIDYSTNFEKICSAAENSESRVNLKVLNNSFPINQITDMIRVVGRTADGGHILLSKAVLRQMPSVELDDRDRALIWWFAVNYDTDAYYPVPMQLGPTEQEFSYKRWNMKDLLKTPLSVVLSHSPIETLGVLKDYTINHPLGAQSD